MFSRGIVQIVFRALRSRGRCSDVATLNTYQDFAGECAGLRRDQTDVLDSELTAFAKGNIDKYNSNM